MGKNCFKKIFCSLGVFALLITAMNTAAQLNPPMGTSQWKYKTPFQYGFVMNDMSFVDNNNGLAVGNNGALAKTTDGGFNWKYLPFKYISTANQVALATLNDVHFVTPSIAYAVGGGGLMVKTIDGGITWTQITTPLTALSRNINAIHFINKDTGYIGGAAINTTNTTSIDDAPKVYFTRNGGTTWDSLVTPFRRRQDNATLSGFNTSEIQRIHFVNDSVGYVTGSCGSSSANYSAILWKIQKNVVIDYSLHRSKFGQTATTGSYTPTTQTYKGLIGINDSLVMISSFNNNVVIRVRTGKNDSTASAVPAVWGAYERGVYEIVIWLNSTATPFPASLVGNVAGQMHHLKKMPDGKILLSAGGNIVVTPDNGTTWSVAPRPPVPYSWWSLFAMDVAPNGRIITGGSSGILYDSLPGTPWRKQWTSVKPLDASGIPNDFSSMDWADCNNGVVVGSNGTFAKTIDGGKTWTDNSSSIFAAAQIGFSKVVYPAVNSMYFSSFNSLYKSPDQGSTIDVIFTEPDANGQLKNFASVGTNRIWIAGYRSGPTTAQRRALIFRTSNATAVSPVWDTVGVFPTGTFVPQFNNIKFANQDTGYVCGSRGKVYRTINGGTTWTDVSPDTTVNSNASNNYSGLSLINGKIIFLGSSSKKMFKSIDAGVTWTDISPLLTTPSTLSAFSNINMIEMNDVNNGYAMAGNFLLKTTDGWATWTYDMAPLSISSMMLYPKVSGPIANKKLYFTTLQASTFVNSQISATILEYGNDALINVSSSEATASSCDNVATGSITITATGGILPYSYSLNGGPFQASNTFNNISQGPKTITIKDAGCQSITKTVTVGVKAGPVISAGPDFIIVDGDNVTLQGTATGVPATIAWTPAATLTGANTLSPVAKPNITTGYTLTVQDVNGCVSTDNAVVTVIPYCIKVMNAFTPNGDGMNDRWLVTNGAACTKQIAVAVYNRYGNIVYKNDNYQNNWDGTYNGKPVADGTYYYSVTFTTITGNTIFLRGDVTILR